jgi:hypothetical protein
VEQLLLDLELAEQLAQLVWLVLPPAALDQQLVLLVVFDYPLIKFTPPPI